ncbi:unnamed protein product [Rhizoctonia solani]|uniref:Extracellular metalloproteinase n=1 Tax=Rhizoctonia solani TaxID=456999 RepID=A0A8H3CR32_9AGAM|nr:unnamed protein product [Rhizoctonia solani]
MGILFRAYVLAAAIATLSPSAALAHRATRKSLNFRPHLVTDFYTDPLPILDTRDPYKTAHAFLRQLAYPDDSYFIRKDSYTDKNTGISYIYVRQVVNGLEVADGNINLNIRDGQVLSYGNSFFQGSLKDSLLSTPNWHQGIYCSEPSTSLRDHACGDALYRLLQVASLHKLDPPIHHHDPRVAVFFFMQTAHPDPTSLVSTFTSLEAKHHECTDLLGQDISCNSWLVSGFGAEVGPIRAHQVYVQTPGVYGSTHLNLVWRLEVPLPDNHYEAYVSLNDPTKIVAVADWVVDAPTPTSDGWLSNLQRHVFGQSQEVLPPQSPDQVESNIKADPGADNPIPTAGTYRVWKWGINDPESGKRTLEVAPTDRRASPLGWHSRTLEVAPTDRRASPLGWHSVPAGNDPLATNPELEEDKIVNYTTTVGNNAIVQENWDAGSDWKENGRANGGSDLVFDFPYGADPSEPGWENVEPRQYRNATITQLFYLTNMYHDLLYLYGFDEVSGNFQQYNFGKGAAEGDAVVVFAQDSGGFNNANFRTPPDGQNGQCRMYLWNTAKPFRDGGLDAGILIHELSHGLSTRLTGGPQNSNCLNSREAGGMGEGWGDYIATSVRSTSTYSDYPIGAWAADTKPGIRHFPYSRDDTVNPSQYDYLQRMDYREVLIDKHGFADSLFPSSDSEFYRYITREDGNLSKAPKHGNTLMLQLIVNGMKTQPCNPTFIQARDAIIAADDALTGGENKCTLWQAFASRGLGTDAKKLTFATKPSINGFEVPPECKP